MTKRISCSCDKKDEPFKHDKNCKLWKSKRFAKGELCWNLHQQKLTTKDEAIDDELASLDEQKTTQVVIGDTNQFDYPRCPTCVTDANVSCVECGQPWLQDECVQTDPEWWCGFCGNVFQFSFDEIEDEDEQDLVEIIEPCSCNPSKKYCWKPCGVQEKNGEWVKIGSSTWSGGGYGYGVGTTYMKCRHYNKQVMLVDGTPVYVSSMKNDRKDDDLIPDWGLYLDYGWHPTWRSEHINWPDYGLPKNFIAAAEAIMHAYELAQNGAKIEIGCIGGHGRTGTALACFAVAAGTPATEAVKWVHDNHCDEAIESKRQEWFPLWFEAWLFGGEVPAMPEEPKATVFCAYTDHAKMYAAGKKECDNDKNCRWWDEDLEKYHKTPVAQSHGTTVTKTGSQSGNQSVIAKPCHCEKGDWSRCPCNSSKLEDCKKCKTAAKSAALVPVITARCVRPGCNEILTHGTLACKCGLCYTMNFWKNHASLKDKTYPKPGTVSGEFTYTGNDDGWVLTEELINTGPPAAKPDLQELLAQYGYTEYEGLF